MTLKNILPFCLFLTLFITNYLTLRLHVLPGVFSWLPELVIAVIAVAVIGRIIANKRFIMPGKYILVFFLFMYVVVTGILINDISTFTVISGIRTYFKYIPLFLLPFAYEYSENDIKKQLLVVLFFGLLQLPVVLYQRFVQFKHLFTGDVITGTLTISNSLSIILIAIIIVLFTLYLKKSLSLKAFLVLSLLVFIPTTLNETKVTPIFLVIGVGAIFFRLRRELSPGVMVFVSTSSIILLFVFSLVYDSVYKRDDGAGLADLFSSQDRLVSNYNFTQYEVDPNVAFNLEKRAIGEAKNLPSADNEFGRIDSFLIPLDAFIAHDVTKLFFGLGIGNVTSKVGEGARYAHIVLLGGAETTLSQLIWETGVIGAALYVLLILLFAKDAYTLANNNDYWGNLATAWFGICLIIFSSIGYNTIFHFDEIACLFIYFSGLIVSKNYLHLRNNNSNNIQTDMYRPN